MSPPAARTALLLLACLLASPSFAQQASAPAEPAAGPGRIPFSSVAEALAALEGKDGNGAIVTHADGWVVVNEPQAAAQWSFTPPGHEAYPAVVRRIVRRGGGGAVDVETSSLCEAAKDPCARLLVEFEALNSRVTQAIKARGRQGSSQAQP
ncbi:hypothetical protein [Methylibium sp.]|uniref:hypothetical protein n=1 Tax=Methylibium sp. TaxID=2067992 RepID=UPI003D0E6C27